MNEIVGEKYFVFLFHYLVKIGRKNILLDNHFCLCAIKSKLLLNSIDCLVALFDEVQVSISALSNLILDRAHHLVEKFKLNKVVICHLHLFNWSIWVVQLLLGKVSGLNFVQ